jgi:hypothetical protein
MGYSDELPDVPGLCHTRKKHYRQAKPLQDIFFQAPQQ